MNEANEKRAKRKQRRSRTTRSKASEQRERSEQTTRSKASEQRAKRKLVLVFLFSLLMIPKMHAQFEGTFGLGIHAGYGAEINSIGAGINAHYYYTNNIRFSPSFTCFAERKGESMWMTDADAHYIFPVSFSASLYPIAGVHYSQWKYDASKDNGNQGGDWTRHRVGTNLGLGFQHDIAYRVRANFELKYQFIPDYSQLVFMAGIGFWF